MSGVLHGLKQIVGGSVTASSTAAQTLIAAPSEGAICITSMQLGRSDTGSSAGLILTFNDVNSTQMLLDNAGFGRSLPIVFDAPLVFPNKTAATFTCSAAITTTFASAQGYLRE